MIELLILCLVGYCVHYLLTRRRVLNPDAHGSARWASVDDLEKAGLLADGPGLGVGYVLKNGKPVKVRLNTSVHCLVTAPSGSGKGASVVVNFLREHRSSLVCFDPKGENFTLCKEHLEANGVRVVRLDPFGVCGPGGDALNPLDVISPTSELMIDQCLAVAREMVDRQGTEQDPFFLDAGTGALATAAAAVCTFPRGDPNRTLPAARGLLASPERVQHLAAELKKETGFGGLLAVKGHALGGHKDKQLAGVLATVDTKCSFMDSVPMARSLAASTFDVSGLVTGRLAVFLILPPDMVKAQAPWARLMVGTLIRACVAGGQSRTETVTFVLDEASSLGQMDCLETMLAIGRSYRVRLHMYYQDLSQLRLCWKEGQDQTVLGSTTQVFFAVSSPQTAQAVSDRLGKETIFVDSYGSSTGGSTTSNDNGMAGSTGRNRGRSTNRSMIARELLRPEEVLTLPASTAVCFPPGCRPVATRLVPYWETVSGPRRRLMTPGRMKALMAAAAGGALLLLNL